MRYFNSLAVAGVGLALAACSSAGSYVKKGDKKAERGEYAYAIENYQRALEKNPANTGEINYKIGEAYRLSNRTHEAAPFYAEAVEANEPKEDLYFHYAMAVKAQGDYAKASEMLNKYIRTGTNIDYINRAKQEIKNLKEIEALAAEPPKFKVENFESLNTPEADYSPLYLNNEMIFTSARGEGKVYAATGGGFTDLYRFRFDALQDSATSAISLFDKKLKMEGVHDAAATVSPDGKMLVFARGNSGKRKGMRDVNLFISYFRNGEWSEPELLPVSDPKAFDTSPAFSRDGKTLYFASNREGGFGGIDLYLAKMDRNGRWTEVRNMGSDLNTKGNEMFPYVSDDGKLYFASDGHPSFGMMDLFVAERREGKISVENLGQPINSRFDDFGITFKNPTEGYFSSNREGGKGDDDIYYFKDVSTTIRNVDFVLSGVTKGRDESGNEAALAGVKLKLVSNGETLAETTTGPDGSFQFPLQPQSNYTVIGEKEDYFTRRDSYSTYGKSIPQEELETDTTLVMDYTFVLDKIVVDKAVVLDNIYYDLGKADIRPDAAQELDKLVDVLNDNPDISVELSAHTDSRGDAALNQKLSQRRAEAAVQYIVSRGITAERVQAKGYGKDKPVVPNAETEEEHQRNRRTEFKVLEINK